MIFISYSTKNRDRATEIYESLKASPFYDVFFDCRTDDGIEPGTDFSRELQLSHQQATTFILLITNAWLESTWCRAEFQVALLAGKRLIPIYLTTIGDLPVPHEIGIIQGIDFHSDFTGGIDRLKETLDRAAEHQCLSLWDYRKALARYVNTVVYDLPGGSHGNLSSWFVPLQLNVRVGPKQMEPKSVAETLRFARAGEINVLTGPAGIGKSTLLKFLATHALERPEVVGFCSPIQPLLLRLRDLSEISSGTLATRIAEAVQRLPRFNLAGAGIPNDFLRVWSAAGRCQWLFLFDAFDEIPAERMPDVGAVLLALSQEFPNSYFVVTARRFEEARRATNSALLLHEVSIASPSRGQALDIARPWKQVSAEEFDRALLSQELDEVTETPLGIVMLASILQTGGGLPDTRLALYERFVDLLGESLKRLGDDVALVKDPRLTRRLLEVIGMNSYLAGGGLETPIILESVRTELVKVGLSPDRAELDAPKCLGALIEHIGIFEGHSWRHLTFCEYLCAKRLASQLQPSNESFLKIFKAEFAAGRQGMLAFAFAHWGRVLVDPARDASLEVFRPAMELVVGTRPHLWLRLLSLGGARKRIAAQPLCSAEAAMLCQWIAAIGGAPSDIEEATLTTLLKCGVDDLGVHALENCASVFTDGGEKELRALQKWQFSGRLRSRLQPLFSQWTRELVQSESENERESLSGLLLKLGAQRELADLVTRDDAQWKLLRPVAKSLRAIRQTPAADQLAAVILQTAAKHARKSSEYFAETLEIGRLRVGIKNKRSDNVLSTWCASNNSHPLAQLFNAFGVLNDDSEAKKGHRVRAPSPEQLHAAQHFVHRMPLVAPLRSRDDLNLLDLDFFAAMLWPDEIARWSVDSAVPGPIRNFLAWWKQNVNLGKDCNVPKQWVLHSLESMNRAGQQDCSQVVNSLLPYVSERYLKNWLSDAGGLEDDRRIFSEIEDLKFYEHLVMANGARSSAKIAWLESWLEKEASRASEQSITDAKSQLAATYALYLNSIPTDHDILIRLADLNLDRGEYAQGLSHIETAIANASCRPQEVPRPWARLRAKCLWFLDREAEALQHVDFVLRQDDADPYMWRVRAHILLNEGRFRQVMASSARGLESEPDDAWLLWLKSRGCFRLGLVDEALAALDAALVAEEDSPASWRMERAWSLSCLGRALESREYIATQCGDVAPGDLLVTRIQNALLLGETEAALSLAAEENNRDVVDYWVHALCALNADDAYNVDCLDRLRKFVAEHVGSDPAPEYFRFWLAVLERNRDGAAEVVAELIGTMKEDDLRWISSDFNVFLKPCVPDWVAALAAEARACADAIGVQTSRELDLPRSASTEGIKDEAGSTGVMSSPMPAQKRAKPLFPAGMLCHLEAIDGYLDEYALACEILDPFAGRTVVVVPLLDTGHIYLQANFKWSAEFDHPFKLCCPFVCTEHYKRLAEILVDKKVRRVYVTDRKLLERLQTLVAWGDLHKRLQLREAELPYSAADVEFES